MRLAERVVSPKPPENKDHAWLTPPGGGVDRKRELARLANRQTGDPPTKNPAALAGANWVQVAKKGTSETPTTYPQPAPAAIVGVR